jgi:hypothetical protein
MIKKACLPVGKEKPIPDICTLTQKLQLKALLHGGYRRFIQQRLKSNLCAAKCF